MISPRRAIRSCANLLPIPSRDISTPGNRIVIGIESITTKRIASSLPDWTLPETTVQLTPGMKVPERLLSSAEARHMEPDPGQYANKALWLTQTTADAAASAEDKDPGHARKRIRGAFGMLEVAPEGQPDRDRPEEPRQNESRFPSGAETLVWRESPPAKEMTSMWECAAQSDGAAGLREIAVTLLSGSSTAISERWAKSSQPSRSAKVGAARAHCCLPASTDGSKGLLRMSRLRLPRQLAGGGFGEGTASCNSTPKETGRHDQ